MKVVLKDLEPADLATIAPWLDPQVFTILKKPVDEKQLGWMLPKYDEAGAPQSLGYKAVDSETNRMVGVIHAVVNSAHRHAHIGQVVVGDPQLRGRGIGQQIMRQMLEICFGRFGLHRVQLLTREDNAIALACYRRAGFQADGILRDLTWTGERYMSEYFLSILEQEWKGRTKKREATQ